MGISISLDKASISMRISRPQRGWEAGRDATRLWPIGGMGSNPLAMLILCFFMRCPPCFDLFLFFCFNLFRRFGAAAVNVRT